MDGFVPWLVLLRAANVAAVLRAVRLPSHRYRTTRMGLPTDPDSGPGVAQARPSTLVVVLSPLADAFINGSLNAILFPAIIFGFAPVAAAAKAFAILPMLAERRWRAIAATVVIYAATLPFLPWSMFLADVPVWSQGLMTQSARMSAYPSLPLMAIGAIALLMIDARRAGWLVVPILWPWTQIDYAAISVPALDRITAAFYAMPFPGFYLIGASVAALRARRSTKHEEDWHRLAA